MRSLESHFKELFLSTLDTDVNKNIRFRFDMDKCIISSVLITITSVVTPGWACRNCRVKGKDLVRYVRHVLHVGHVAIECARYASSRRIFENVPTANVTEIERGQCSLFHD